jgi:predicted adenine nucleotide alpha hydrolase (AANH) superfamily ATPase
MIVHICCSVDSWYYLQKIREKYPEETLIGFFYNPNIHPESEYQTRLIDSRRSCERLGIEWMEGPYDPESWMSATRGLECAPEKGARCAVCFDQRLFKTAELAQKMGHACYTTTLLMSPKKDFSQLQAAADRLMERFSPCFVIEDFRKEGGTQAQFALAKEVQAYQQNYCGCFYALRAQREAQKRLPVELFSPLAGADGLQRRQELYARREQLEKAGQNPQIIKTRTLRWHLLAGGLWDQKGQAIESEILPDSVGCYRFKTNMRRVSDEVAAFEKQPGVVIARSFFDRHGGKSHTVRRALGFTGRDVTPIFVVDRLPALALRVVLEAHLSEESGGLLAPFE